MATFGERWEWQPPHEAELDGELVRFCQVLITERIGTWVCGREIPRTEQTCQEHKIGG